MTRNGIAIFVIALIALLPIGSVFIVNREQSAEAQYGQTQYGQPQYGQTQYTGVPSFGEPQVVQGVPLNNLPNNVSSNVGTVLVRPAPEPTRWLVDFTLQDDPIVPGKKVQIITIVDPESKHILVYQRDGGDVKLLSSRSLVGDLMLDEHNAVSPTPSEIEREIRQLRNRPR